MHFNRAASDQQAPAVNQGFGYFMTPRFQDTGKGGAGDAHLFGSLLLVKALQVGQANGFELIQVQSDWFG
jgi:predicted RNA-binding protein with TRAM domain